MKIYTENYDENAQASKTDKGYNKPTQSKINNWNVFGS